MPASFRQPAGVHRWTATRGARSAPQSWRSALGTSRLALRAPFVKIKEGFSRKSDCTCYRCSILPATRARTVNDRKAFIPTLPYNYSYETQIGLVLGMYRIPRYFRIPTKRAHILCILCLLPIFPSTCCQQIQKQISAARHSGPLAPRT